MTKYRRWREQGLCGSCGKKSRENKSSCLSCYKAQKKWQKENYKHTPRKRVSQEQQKENQRLYRLANREKKKQYDLLYRPIKNLKRRERYKNDSIYREEILSIPRDKEKRKIDRLFPQYGIKREEYERILAEQNGVCAICEQPCSTGRNLAVDHNHETGEIRGLLCSKHNMALGLFADDQSLLLKAVEYLKRGALKSASDIGLNRGRILLRNI